MNFADYQQQARQTAVYPRTVGDFGMAYCALKLNGEVAELGDKLDELASAPAGDADARIELVRKEAGDVYWYIANLALEATVAAGNTVVTLHFDTSRECSTFLSRRAGAVAEVIGKAYRDHEGRLTAERQVAVGVALDEMLAALAWLVSEVLGTNVEAVLTANIAKLRDRQQRGVLRGSGDER